MEGRWSIYQGRASGVGAWTPEPVPVVPCDDAAIERAAAALANRGVMSHREDVEVAFRAAAEVPR
jgi:hypothetical protein